MNLAADLGAVQRRIAAIAGDPCAPSATSAVLAPPPGGTLSAGAGAFAALLPPLGPVPVARPLDPARLGRLVADAAGRAGVDRRLVAAVVAAESGGDPRATSAAGAAGLMQLMPATARALGVADSYDAVQNVRGGARYLRELLDRFAGDVPCAVAAYNAGPGSVERYGGVPPYVETRAYVGRVLAALGRPDPR